MNKQELKKFLSCPSNTVIGIVLCLIGVAMAIGFGIGAVAFMVVLSVIVAVIGLFMTISSIKDAKKLNQWLDEMEATGKLPYILQEFSTAPAFFKNALRLGSTYIFSKNRGEILRYENIERVYQHVSKTNGAEDARSLCMRTKDGKVYTLCYLPIKGKGDQELMLALQVMLMRNPSIQIGYR